MSRCSHYRDLLASIVATAFGGQRVQNGFKYNEAV